MLKLPFFHLQEGTFYCYEFIRGHHKSVKLLQSRVNVCIFWYSGSILVSSLVRLDVLYAYSNYSFWSSYKVICFCFRQKC